MKKNRRLIRNMGTYKIVPPFTDLIEQHIYFSTNFEEKSIKEDLIEYLSLIHI